jgi:hypothetical protein
MLKRKVCSTFVSFLNLSRHDQMTSVFRIGNFEEQMNGVRYLNKGISRLGRTKWMLCAWGIDGLRQEDEEMERK